VGVIVAAEPPAVEPSADGPTGHEPQASGGGDAFDALYRREYPQLVGLAYALCGRRDVAEEIVQDAMVKTLARWSKVREYERPGAFVRRIVLHDTTSALRRRSAEMRALARLGERRSDAAGIDPDVDEFWRLVRALPTRQAQVVALFYGDDQPTAEIALLLGVAEGTVRATLAQARGALRSQLEGESHE
ncbi:MAG TPA: sigma-70 family RNA polymerase sigma factor, partial [Acidimicrobiia bacterium]